MDAWVNDDLGELDAVWGEIIEVLGSDCDASNVFSSG